MFHIHLRAIHVCVNAVFVISCLFKIPCVSCQRGVLHNFKASSALQTVFEIVFCFRLCSGKRKIHFLSFFTCRIRGSRCQLIQTGNRLYDMLFRFRRIDYRIDRKSLFLFQDLRLLRGCSCCQQSAPPLLCLR